METNSLQNTKAVFRGRYRIIGRIGQGAMGSVYKATLEEYPDQTVAIKILASEHLGNRKVLQRFQNEMEACYRISHPNVVKPIEVVREKGIFGYSMEYVDGGNLTTLRFPLSDLEVTQVIKQVASALSAVHTSGVIHRDVKPENILISQSGVVKLTDFGTALLIGGPRVTSEGNVLGSIPYLSPEYIERQQLDIRSDLYSLGIVAYELLTGAVPFAGEGIAGMINRKLQGEPIFLSGKGRLKRAVERLLAQLPEERFQSADAAEHEFRLLETELNPH